MGYIDETARRVESQHHEGMSIIDTLQSLLIAFILAFTFRGFVVEAFVIPTGSMAPTLLGAHAMVRSPHTGYTYPVGPARRDTKDGQALPLLGRSGPYHLTDPMLMSSRADEVVVANRRTRMGDRILVLKYLYSIVEPKRFDVVVFKNPTNPSENYIKRLIGLPGEAVWLADGDVFARPNGSQSIEGFRVQRKPEHVQRAVWQPVYHSEYIPVDPSRIRGGWPGPWSGEGWETNDRRSYRKATADAGMLTFNPGRAVNDRHPYNEPIDDENEQAGERLNILNVSDIRLAGAIVADLGGLASTIRIECRDHEFEAVLEGTRALLRMRRLGRDEWTVLDERAIPSFAPSGVVTEVEFWHADQALHLWVNGRQAAYGQYEWTPAQRLEWATGLPPEMASDGTRGNPYVAWEKPPRAMRLSWHFRGSPLTLHRVELDRDLYYQPANDRHTGGPALGTHPDTLVHLDSSQFFVCGDNSPASLDGRLWGEPSPWIAREIDDAPGVVNRSLLLGKAFFVYFPSPEGVREGAYRFVPNFGQMRFIH